MMEFGNKKSPSIRKAGLILTQWFLTGAEGRKSETADVSKPVSEILREDVLKDLDLTATEAAKRIGISRQQLHRILSCTHPITIDVALRIGKYTGNGPGLMIF